jgi:hypothetical protein
MNELLEVLAELAPLEAPLRWPDPPDIDAEYVAALLVASPAVSARIRATVEVLLERGSLRELVDALDFVAVRFGQDGDSETASALLDLSGVFRDWGDRRCQPR